MGNVGFDARRRSCVRPQLCLMLGGAITGALVVIGCADEGESVLGGLGGSPAGGGGAAAMAGASSGSGGVATAGSPGSSGSGTNMAGTSGSPSTGTGGSAGGAGSAPGGGGTGGVAGAGAGGGGNGGAGGVDECPGDSTKTEPGECGCGAEDVDTDGDGTFDCKDDCLEDPDKTAPGVCGCGLSDTANADGDAAVDCKDACPHDPALTQAGNCGCLPDSLGALCLAHRYQFDGTGTVATDSIAGATGNGTVVGATLSGTGTLVLAGGTSDQYVKLPSRLISALGNSATIEAWVTWAGTGGDWQRIFDFGSSDAGEGMQGDGQGYLFLTPRAVGDVMRVAISPLGNPEEDQVSAGAALPTTLTHVAVVIDGAAKTLTLYQGGVSQGTPATIRDAAALSGLKDLNNWLGRSQYQNDEELGGTYHELRIYSRALSSAQITASGTAGPDAMP